MREPLNKVLTLRPSHKNKRHLSNLIEKKVTVKKSQVDNVVPHDEALRTQSSRPPARLLGCLVHHAPYRCSLAIARSVRDEHALSLLLLLPLMSANISPAVKDLQINRVEGGKQRRLDEGKQQSIGYAFVGNHAPR